MLVAHVREHIVLMQSLKNVIAKRQAYFSLYIAFLRPAATDLSHTFAILFSFYDKLWCNSTSHRLLDNAWWRIILNSTPLTNETLCGQCARKDIGVVSYKLTTGEQIDVVEAVFKQSLNVIRNFNMNIMLSKLESSRLFYVTKTSYFDRNIAISH